MRRVPWRTLACAISWMRLGQRRVERRTLRLVVQCRVRLPEQRARPPKTDLIRLLPIADQRFAPRLRDLATPLLPRIRVRSPLPC